MPTRAQIMGQSIGERGQKNCCKFPVPRRGVWDAAHCIVFFRLVALTLVFHTQLILSSSSLYLSLCVYALLVPLCSLPFLILLLKSWQAIPEYPLCKSYYRFGLLFICERESRNPARGALEDICKLPNKPTKTLIFIAEKRGLQERLSSSESNIGKHILHSCYPKHLRLLNLTISPHLFQFLASVRTLALALIKESSKDQFVWASLAYS